MTPHRNVLSAENKIARPRRCQITTPFPAVKALARSYEHNHQKNMMVVGYMTQYDRYIKKKKALTLESDLKNILKS